MCVVLWKSFQILWYRFDVRGFFGSLGDDWISTDCQLVFDRLAARVGWASSRDVGVSLIILPQSSWSKHSETGVLISSSLE